jgi:hypothetical protein
MHSIRVLTLFASAIAAIPSSLPQAHAADSCQPVFDALTRVVTTPGHSYTTHTAALVNGSKPRSSETIDAEGTEWRISGPRGMEMMEK